MQKKNSMFTYWVVQNGRMGPLRFQDTKQRERDYVCGWIMKKDMVWLHWESPLAFQAHSESVANPSECSALHTSSWAQYRFPSSHLKLSVWHQSPPFHYCLSGRIGTAWPNLCRLLTVYSQRYYTCVTNQVVTENPFCLWNSLLFIICHCILSQQLNW